jgi:hypothetical protein
VTPALRDYLVWPADGTPDEAHAIREADASSAAAEWGLRYVSSRAHPSLQHVVDVRGPWGDVTRHAVDVEVRAVAEPMPRPQFS